MMIRRLLWIATLLLAGIVFLTPGPLLAAVDSARCRDSFVGGDWIGAQYVGMGMSGEVLADDVFAIYWNPAGISELRGQKRMSIGEIKEKARQGEADKINEEDLVKFSQGEKERSVFQIGMSGAMLDRDRNSGFLGLAFSLPKGVMGIGFYSLFSLGVEGRDPAGVRTGEYDYVGNQAIISYGWSFGVSSIGVSVKVVSETIGDTSYLGAGADLGTQVYILPFLKVGFVIQDMGTGFYPLQDRTGERKRYDVTYPTLKLGLSISSDAGLTVAAAMVKKLERKGYGFRFGIEYELVKYFALRVGMNNEWFTAGATVEAYNFSLSYAFVLDPFNDGYNNILSLMFLF